MYNVDELPPGFAQYYETKLIEKAFSGMFKGLKEDDLQPFLMNCIVDDDNATDEMYVYYFGMLKERLTHVDRLTISPTNVEFIDGGRAYVYINDVRFELRKPMPEKWSILLNKISFRYNRTGK